MLSAPGLARGMRHREENIALLCAGGRALSSLTVPPVAAILMNRRSASIHSAFPAAHFRRLVNLRNALQRPAPRALGRQGNGVAEPKFGMTA